MMYQSIVQGMGSYLPKRIVTNNDIAKTMDTSDEWIQTRTGIKQRHFAADNEMTSDMAYYASVKALDDAGMSAENLDMIVVATTTPDHVFPATAVKVQEMLGAKRAFAFDLQAVCSGFVYAITTADQYIKTGQAKNVLVIGAEKLSTLIDLSDRSTGMLFGDGAGAVVLSASSDKNVGILSKATFMIPTSLLLSQ